MKHLDVIAAGHLQFVLLSLAESGNYTAGQCRGEPNTPAASVVLALTLTLDTCSIKQMFALRAVPPTRFRRK